MKDRTTDILTLAGVDIDGARERFMGNDGLLLRMLFKIDTDKNYADLVEAFETGDSNATVSVSHTLKGLYGNLSVTPLYDLFTKQTVLLRSGDFDAAKSMLSDVKRELDSLREAILSAKEAEEN